MVRYYTGARAYREKGPPALPLRMLAPVLVAATIGIFASGVALALTLLPAITDRVARAGGG